MLVDVTAGYLGSLNYILVYLVFFGKLLYTVSVFCQRFGCFRLLTVASILLKLLLILYFLQLAFAFFYSRTCLIYTWGVFYCCSLVCILCGTHKFYSIFIWLFYVVLNLLFKPLCIVFIVLPCKGIYSNAWWNSPNSSELWMSVSKL